MDNYCILYSRLIEFLNCGQSNYRSDRARPGPFSQTFTVESKCPRYEFGPLRTIIKLIEDCDSLVCSKDRNRRIYIFLFYMLWLGLGLFWGLVYSL